MITITFQVDIYKANFHEERKDCEKAHAALEDLGIENERQCTKIAKLQKKKTNLRTQLENSKKVISNLREQIEQCCEKEDLRREVERRNSSGDCTGELAIKEV